MTWVAKTLWDLLPPRRRPPPATPPPRRRKGRESGVRARYDAVVTEMKAEHRVRVHRWRTSTSGCAWELRAADGTVSRLIEAPYPRGPMSLSVFLHEVGHHAIGFGRYRPRCLEEYYAWKWAIDTMHARGFNVTDAVEKRRRDALRYALAKAIRRGLRRVPAELVEYLGEQRR